MQQPMQEFEKYPGIYRGTVAAVDDPDKRKRYRVRVSNVHPAAVEVNHLPWAELGTVFGGNLFGDIPGYEVGDQVWVMFEGANRRFPVIMGGIFNYGGGTPPLPAEQVGDEYTRSAKRWVRTDRAGNKIEMSPLEDELYVRIETIDGSTLEVSATEGAITLRGLARVFVEAPTVEVEATDILATATALVADVAETATIRSLGEVNLRAASTVNIGEYQPEDATGIGAQPPETTPNVIIKAVNLVQVESADLIDVDAAGQLQVDIVGNITVNGSADLTITCAGNTLIDLEGTCQLDVEGATTINAVGAVALNASDTVSIDAAGALDINCSVDVTFHADATFSMDSGSTLSIATSADMNIDATASLTISTSANMDLSANGQMSLSAPTISIEATALLDMSGGSLAQLDAGAILIG